MHPFHNSAFPPVHPAHGQPQFMWPVQHPTAAPQATASHGHSSHAFDSMIKKRYKEADSKLQDAVSHSQFPSPETKQQCSHFINRLRVYRYLFMHTFVHVVSCRRSGLTKLVENANHWKEWNSVQQLTYHSFIRDKLLSFWEGSPCRQHESLRSHRFVIQADDDDLLSNLLYCGKKPELYELTHKPAVTEHGHYVKQSEQIVELLWEFLVKSRENDVVRRLRSHIYRMARKSAYLPHALRIGHPSISNEQPFAGGANGRVSKARMNGKDVVIKRILCRDVASQKECLELFASEAILWKTLQHKNIVPFLGVIAEGTLDVGMVSLFLRNGNIKNFIARCDPRDRLAKARAWGKDLAEGLDYIHSHEPPIIHGDLKADNVLVDDDGHARLGDFGQSHASDSGKYLDSTRVGLAISPVYWMAPELMLADDDPKATEKSDIYSLGCVLYEMVSGKIPFEGLELGHVVTYVTKGTRPSKPHSINERDPFWKLIESCWKGRPEDRPSAAQVISFRV